MQSEESAHKELGLRVGADIFLKQQDLIWDQIKHVSTLEIATLAGWFYLISQNKHAFSLLILIFSSAFLFIILMIIRRQAQLQDQYRRGISSIIVAMPARNTGPLNEFDFSQIKKHSIDIRAHVLARAIPFLAMLGNAFLFLVTLQIWLPQNFPDSRIAIFIVPASAVLIGSAYLKNSTSILKKLLVN